MPREIALTWMVFLAVGLAVLRGQEAPLEGEVGGDAEAMSEEVPGPFQVRANNARELLKQLNEQARKDQERIREIEGILFPYEDKVAVEVFFFAPGEYTFLRKQSEGARTATQFFQAQTQIDRSSWDGVSLFFDMAYDAMRAGYLWVGREQGLINEDVQLFNELRTKVQEEIRKRPEGAEMMKLAQEREQLLAKAKTSAPLLKYFNERRQWWKGYPDYEAVITGQ